MNIIKRIQSNTITRNISMQYYQKQKEQEELFGLINNRGYLFFAR